MNLLALCVTAHLLTMCSYIAMAICANADFEQPQVPVDQGANPWVPPTDKPWSFAHGAALLNTAAPSWKGPHADDGNQVVVFTASNSLISQTLRDLTPGTVYHLRWSEITGSSSSSPTLLVTLTNHCGSSPQIIKSRTLSHANSWVRKELVFVAESSECTLTFAAPPTHLPTPLFLDRVRLWPEPPSPPPEFPRFVVPGYDNEMDALRNLFFLHYTSGRILATFSMHWMAESALWPALESYNGFSQRAWSREAISSRSISPEGYVSCHQHVGLGHPEGWPFPLWIQGPGIGWHFATHAVPWFAPVNASDTTPACTGLTTISYSAHDGWHLRIVDPTACIEFPSFSSPFIVASYFIIDWIATSVPTNARCFLEWRSQLHPTFSPERRIPIELTDRFPRHHQQWISLRDHPAWSLNDILSGVRLVFENATGTEIQFFYLCSSVDTRHNYNGALYIDACHSYATWCGDVPLLQTELPRMRRAMDFMLTEFQVLEHGCVYTPWLGHDGSSGIFYDEHGVKHIRHGYGIGNNYWDLLPFGGRDPFATLYLYAALNKLAELEEAAAHHPEWNISPPPPHLAPNRLRHLARLLKQANTQFWNAATGRFAPVDLAGTMHDYGFTFLNCEAVYYDYASPAQAEAIMQWLEGSRIVPGDTSTGADIYRWRFGPRATTRRNIDYYAYPWCCPEDIPFGGQVQDGGAVLGFSYHDLMLRLRTRGPDNAWQRLREIIAWFREVQAEGGYREYYYGSTVDTRGTLQGGGTAGGLGLDCEFFESILVPQIMIYGFLGLQPKMDGLVISPRLPSTWPSLTITNIRFHNTNLDVTVTPNQISLALADGPANFCVFLPHATWHITYASQDGTPVRDIHAELSDASPSIPVCVDHSSRFVATRVTPQ